MDDEYYEIETLEDSSESFERLKKYAQKAPVTFTNWRFEQMPFDKFILYKLDVSKGGARISVSIEVVQKEVLEVSVYAENTKLETEDVNKMVEIKLDYFTSQTIDKLLKFFDEHTCVKGEQSHPKLLDEEEKHNNLAHFFSNDDINICRFCFILEEKSTERFHNYTYDLQKAFEELALLHTKHKKAPTKVCDSCTKQLLQAHQARTDFIAADKTLEDAARISQVVVVKLEGQSSSARKMNTEEYVEVIMKLNQENSSSGEENTKRRPSILKSRARKVAKRR